MKFLPVRAIFLLLLAVMRPAAALPAAAPSSPAQVVQQFLDARAAGQLDRAYALLSTPSHKLLPVAQFRQGDVKLMLGADAKFPPSIPALINLIDDTHNQSGYRFTVQGLAPGNPNIVLVSAQPPGGQLAVVIKIATVPDAQQGGALRIDLSATADADPDLARARDQARMASSKSNLRQLSIGITEYLQDHDETYPPADHWVEAITPYVKDKQVFHDPSAPEREAYSYAFNRALSRRSFAEPMVPQSTVLLFESSKAVKDASDTGQSVPRPGRHHGGTDYAFVDGHVAWLRDGAKPSYRLDGK